MSTISTTITQGITLGTSGAYTSPLTITSTGAVDVSSGYAITGPSAGSPWTVVNHGTIQNTGNGSGFHFGVILSSGTLDNSGRINAPTPVWFDNPGSTVTNSGTILGGVTGVTLRRGGRVDNNGGLIQGTNEAVYTYFHPSGIAGTVTNTGTILGLGNAWGIFLGAGGIIDNEEGLIEGSVGVNVATVTRLGEIVTSRGGPATIINTGTITGRDGDGIVFGSKNGSSTLVNAGTISGGNGTAVQFAGGGNLLIVDPGAVFIGNVDGGTGTNKLELAAGASTGTLSGLGTSFTNFGSVTVEPSAAWRVTIDDPAAFTGTLYGLGADDTLDLTSVAFDGAGNATLLSGNVLQITENGSNVTINLDPNQSFTGFSFGLASDLTSGTLVKLTATFQTSRLALANFGIDAGGWTSQDRYPRALGDVNGDGLSDIVGFGEAGTWVSLATGGGAFAQPILALANFGVSAGGWTSQDQYPRELADVNGDGRADIVGFGYAGIWVAHGRTDGAFDKAAFDFGDFGYADAAGGWTGADTYPRRVADATGDHKAELVGFGVSGVYLAIAGDP
jgi:adhesin HecA-like repeat protein